MSALASNRTGSHARWEFESWLASPKRLALLSALVLSPVIFLIYFSSLGTGFFADDYNFLEPAVRLGLSDYLVHYFDPRVQTLWYRPLQGIQFLIEYRLFGANAAAYHVVNVLFHLANCLLLFGLVWRISKNWRLGFLSALCYATFPVYALAVNWINITDPLMTIFYLLGIWFWWNYLHGGRGRDYILTLVFFVLALLTKQIALTLPVVLFLIDRLLVADSWNISKISSRYWPFAPIALVFVAAQYSARSTHVFAIVFGYSVGVHTASILVQYLSLLVFPWGYYPPTDTQITEGLPFVDERNIVWLATALLLYLFAVTRTRSRALVLLGAALVLTLLPVLPFPFAELRYLYLPAMVSAILLALLFETAFITLRHPGWFVAFASIILALLIVGDSFSVANANAGIFEIARQRRVPFRDISREHPTFPADTHLYFIDSPSPPSELSGMFLLRYGPGVTVGSNDWGAGALRGHNATFVYYFDEAGRARQVPVEKAIKANPSPPTPINFQSMIRLEGYELAQSTIKRGEVVIALLYWRAVTTIDKDYTVFVHLIDENGQMRAGYDSQPRKGEAPTRAWIPNQAVVDAIVLTVPPDTPTGNNYSLEVGLYYLPTSQRLGIIDDQGRSIADKFVLAPLSIAD